MRTRDIVRIAVKDLLQQKGIKQVRLAEAVGETQSNICEFLKGDRPLHHKIERIANFLGTDYLGLIKYGKILCNDEAVVQHLIYDKYIKYKNKKIKTNTLYSKIRFIFSNDEPEREYLIGQINTYYDKIINRQKSSQSVQSRKHRRKKTGS